MQQCLHRMNSTANCRQTHISMKRYTVFSRISIMSSKTLGVKPRARTPVGRCNAVIALDFDGVICDSCAESSLSAFKAASRLWPEQFATPAVEARKGQLLGQMHVVRPVVETGFEFILQIRSLLEGRSTEEILQGWPHMMAKCMQQWGLNRPQLVKLFGEVRDEWIRTDVSGWLSQNRIYPGVAQPLANALNSQQLYIVTTKQPHYTEMLLRDSAGVALPPERIFSQTATGKPKTEVLTQLQATHPDAGVYVFVEDKLGTLEKVVADPTLSRWRLYLVDWGYNTAEERARAAANPRIQIIGKEQFAQLLGAPATASGTSTAPPL